MTIETAEKLICPFGQKCITESCMAWRWFDTEIKNDGYCGVAGKEGAE